MGSYATEHADALADLLDAGASVTFSYTDPGTYDAESDEFVSPTTTTITGGAIQVRGDPETYRALSLIEAEALTLFFGPTTYGSVPEPGYTITWSGVKYTVRDVKKLAPDGTVIAAKVVISR